MEPTFVGLGHFGLRKKCSIAPLLRQPEGLRPAEVTVQWNRPAGRDSTKVGGRRAGSLTEWRANPEGYSSAGDSIHVLKLASQWRYVGIEYATARNRSYFR